MLAVAGSSGCCYLLYVLPAVVLTLTNVQPTPVAEHRGSDGAAQQQLAVCGGLPWSAE